MSKLNFFREIRKGIFVFVPLALLAGYSIHEASARRAGVLGQSQIGCSGPTSPGTPECHGAQSNATVVKFWTDSTGFGLGGSYLFTFSVSNPSERGAGLDISVDNGDTIFAAESSRDFQTFGSEATQLQPLLFTGDSSVWTFIYKPGKAGIRHLYGAGNAVNMNTLEDPTDHWDTTTYFINVETSGVNATTQELPIPTIYPNPCRGIVTLSSPALSGLATIEVSDASGRTILNEEIILGSRTPLDFSNLSAGSYFVSVKPKSGKPFSQHLIIQN